MHIPGPHKVCHIVDGQDADDISLSCTCNTMARADPAFKRIFLNPGRECCLAQGDGNGDNGQSLKGSGREPGQIVRC